MNRYVLIIVINLVSINIYSQNYNYPLGGLMPNGEQEISILSKTRSLRILPESVSLKKYCPFVGQQSYLDCTAWACSYSALSIHNAIKNQWTNRKLITDFSYSVSFIYNQLKSTDDCSTTGITIESALQSLKEVGCLRQKEFGYGCEYLVKKEDYEIASHHRIDDFFLLNNDEAGQINFKDIKLSLAEGAPVIVAIDAYKSFSETCNKQKFWNGNLDYKRGIHALTIIGYDDRSESFELMNSWGKDWGIEGFIRVKYSDFRKILLNAYIIKTNELERKNAKKSNLLSGQILFEDENGDEIMINTKNDYWFEFSQHMTSNSSFRIINQISQPSYFYIIGSDHDNNGKLLFPSSKSESAYIPFRNSEMYFPSLGQWITLDEVVGTDYLCIILSKDGFSVDLFLNKMNRIKGDFIDRCMTNIESEFTLNNQNISLNNGTNIHFKLENPHDSNLIFFVQIEHDD